MALTVHLFPCLSDNYGFLIRDETTGAVATIDTPDADAILAQLDKLGWGRLDLILNTHWHPDHAGGNVAIQAATGCEIVGPEEVRRVTRWVTSSIAQSRMTSPSLAIPCSRSVAGDCSRVLQSRCGPACQPSRPGPTRPFSMARTSTRPPTPASRCLSMTGPR